MPNPPVKLKLYLGKGITGKRLDVIEDMKELPNEFDAKAQSMLVRTVPVWLFPQPNFAGRSIQIVKGGGAEDLSTLPGNWLNKIRSIRFS